VRPNVFREEEAEAMRAALANVTGGRVGDVSLFDLLNEVPPREGVLVEVAMEKLGAALQVAPTLTPPHVDPKLALHDSNA
jgi:hypothetical protein